MPGAQVRGVGVGRGGGWRERAGVREGVRRRVFFDRGPRHGTVPSFFGPKSMLARMTGSTLPPPRRGMFASRCCPVRVRGEEARVSETRAENVQTAAALRRHTLVRLSSLFVKKVRTTSTPFPPRARTPVRVLGRSLHTGTAQHARVCTEERACGSCRQATLRSIDARRRAVARKKTQGNGRAPHASPRPPPSARTPGASGSPQGVEAAVLSQRPRRPRALHKKKAAAAQMASAAVCGAAAHTTHVPSARRATGD